MIKVMPTARSPVMETCRMTLNRFTEDRNRGSITAKTAMRRMRKISGANFAKIPNTSGMDDPGAGAAFTSAIELSPAAHAARAAPCGWASVIMLISFS
jgi:hypothetical protein